MRGGVTARQTNRQKVDVQNGPVLLAVDKVMLLFEECHADCKHPHIIEWMW